MNSNSDTLPAKHHLYPAIKKSALSGLKYHSSLSLFDMHSLCKIAQEGTFRTNNDGVAMASQSLMTPPF